MTTKSDWRDEMPSTEELLAYDRGELVGADAARVSAFLDANPDMAHALQQPFPEDDAKPGDLYYLSEDEVSKRWVALRRDIRPAGRVVRFPVLAALAASLAIVFAGLYWQQRSQLREARSPMLLDVTQIVEPENGRRGTSAGPQLLNVRDGVVVVLQLSDAERFPWYEIEVFDAQSNEKTWKSEPTQPHDGGVSFGLPRMSLEPGTYRVKVFGLSETERDEVDSYLVRVPAR